MTLSADPLKQMVTKTSEIISRIILVFSVFAWQLKVSNPIVPRLHGLPKVHKIPLKMRPIVSNISAPTYKVAKWLVKTFNGLNSSEGRYVKNSNDFVEKIKDVRIGDDEIMVSFDIVSLYPNVPLPAAIESIVNWLRTTNTTESQQSVLADATRVCMYQNQFQFRNKFYKLRKGTSNGNPLSCFVSNVFMCRFEEELIHILPKVWWRFVDDVFTIVKKSQVNDLLKAINETSYSSIRFTCEVESDGKLPFLDLMLTRTQHGSIDVNVYRKPTATARFITSESF